jgi:hypothetical protein
MPNQKRTLSQHVGSKIKDINNSLATVEDEIGTLRVDQKIRATEYGSYDLPVDLVDRISAKLDRAQKKLYNISDTTITIQYNVPALLPIVMPQTAIELAEQVLMAARKANEQREQALQDQIRCSEEVGKKARAIAVKAQQETKLVEHREAALKQKIHAFEQYANTQLGATQGQLIYAQQQINTLTNQRTELMAANNNLLAENARLLRDLDMSTTLLLAWHNVGRQSQTKSSGAAAAPANASAAIEAPKSKTPPPRA